MIDKMSDWRAELARDGVTAKQKRFIFDILKNSSEISFSGIKSGLTNRGVKRINSANLRKYLEKEPKIRKMTTVNGAVSYKLVE